MSDLRADSEIADGIHWISHGFVNSYIVEHGSSLLLVDAGMDKRAEKILNYIKHELQDRKVTRIFMTHHHMDHFRGAYKIYETYHPTVHTTEQDATVITGKEPSPPPNNIFLRPVFSILRPFTKARPITDVQLLNDGEQLDSLTIYGLPGHTMGSLGYKRLDLLMSGDAAVVNKKGEVSLGSKTFAEYMRSAKKSMLRIGELEVDQLLPGHGKPILEEAHKYVMDFLKKADLL